jgi:hypothetical protein
MGAMSAGQLTTVVLVAAGIPLSLLRLWLIWWRGTCSGCHAKRSACTCAWSEPGL